MGIIEKNKKCLKILKYLRLEAKVFEIMKTN